MINRRRLNVPVIDRALVRVRVGVIKSFKNGVILEIYRLHIMLVVVLVL